MWFDNNICGVVFLNSLFWLRLNKVLWLFMIIGFDIYYYCK